MAERTGNGGHGLVKGATVFGLAVPMIVIVPLVMLMSLSTILVAMVQSQYGTNCGLSNAAGTTTSWVEWAKNIAADDSHGYSQPRRTQPGLRLLQPGLLRVETGRPGRGLVPLLHLR